MFKSGLNGGDSSFDIMSQARLLSASGLLGGGGGGAAARGPMVNSLNLQSHLAGAATSSNPLLALLLKHSLGNGNINNNQSNNNNNSAIMPSMDLLLARQKLLLGSSAPNSNSGGGGGGSPLNNLSFLANAAQRLQPAHTRASSSNTSSTTSTVSQVIRKRTSGSRMAAPELKEDESATSNKRRRIAQQHSWKPSCKTSSNSATFRLPRPTGDGEETPFKDHSLKTFRSKWADLDKKASSLKSVKTDAEKAEFMREMFARSLRDGSVLPRGLKKTKKSE